MATLTNFEKGALDYVRQAHIGNLHALIAAIEGRYPDEEDDPEGCEEFKAGFNFARKCADNDPSEKLRAEISAIITAQ